MNAALNRRLPLALAVFVVVLLEQLLAFPRSIQWIAPVLIVSTFFTVWQLSERKIRRIFFWETLLLPGLLVTGALLFIIFLEAHLTRHFVIFILGLLLWLFLEAVYLRQYDRPRYQPHALENISSHLSVAAAFFWYTGLYRLNIYFQMADWLVSILAGVVGCALLYQLLWTADIPSRAGRASIALLGIMLAELALVLSTLPTSVYVNGTVLTACFYTMSGIIRNWLHGIQEAKVMRRYVLLGGLIALVILLTAKWG